MLAYLKDRVCEDCGERNSVVLEFDHVRGEKRDNVGTLLAQGFNWSAIEKEISKCDVVCANCHRKRTYFRAGSYRTDDRIGG
jgi:hypothetical protein